MIEYLAEHWDGWILHVIIAAVVMHPIVTNLYPRFVFALQVIAWPLREAWQHQGAGNVWDGLMNIWTLHRIWEFTAPIIAAGIMLVILEIFPYRRKKKRE